jgi:UDP-N-acetylglucosamine enolpyruvyl transferase
MTKYIVQGGHPLFGEVRISGAKNAAVAIIPAALLVDGVCRIENIPQISDVTALLKILEQLGANVRFLNRSDVRTEVDDRNEKIGRKIRDNELKRIPYLLIVGEKEEAEGLVSVRAQGEGDKGQMTMETFRDLITGLVKEEIDANKLEKK